ncbi:MAG: RIP metalloprotease RseP [Candidatus Zixiibacteriota bacterium]|nr:MAG: RIP metalloprotease RseP [candidate division Zixibacteria bacterium]
MILTLLAFIVVLGVIIFVHELGHFLAAKAVGIRVETFSLGFPPKAVSRKVGETEYVIGWVPLGGYVKMAGMVDESMDEKPLTGAPWEFMSKSYPQKIFVISAGVLMNFLLGILIFFLLTWFIGIAQVGGPVVGAVVPGLPAADAGIQEGDTITVINGQEIATWQELTDIVHPAAGESLMVRWVHEGETREALLVPQERTFPQGDSTVTLGLIGINPRANFEKVGLFEAFRNGLRITWFIITQSLRVVQMLITGQAGMNDVAGPIGIAQISGQTIRSGVVDFISLIANVSVSIGLLNILPLPVLDGGHLVFITIEAIIRRPIPTKVKLNIQKVGLVLLLALFLVVSFNDILRFF